VRQLVNKQNFDNIKKHGTNVKKKNTFSSSLLAAFPLIQVSACIKMKECVTESRLSQR